MQNTTRDPGSHDPTGSSSGERRVEDRAEEVVERISAGVARLARRAVARAREEVEDIVAEAQSVRRGNTRRD